MCGGGPAEDVVGVGGGRGGEEEPGLGQGGGGGGVLEQGHSHQQAQYKQVKRDCFLTQQES